MNTYSAIWFLDDICWISHTFKNEMSEYYTLYEGLTDTMLHRCCELC